MAPVRNGGHRCGSTGRPTAREPDVSSSIPPDREPGRWEVDLHFSANDSSDACDREITTVTGTQRSRPRAATIEAHHRRMMWRLRMTLADRPGLLAQVATACGAAGVNILAMQVFRTETGAVDELVVEADDAWNELELAALVEGAGGDAVAVTRTDEADLDDAPTRYLRAVHDVIEGGQDVEAVLRALLRTEPPDVADYTGHDVLDLRRRDGSVLRISRAVPFTPVERARAQALLSLVSDAGMDVPLIAPSAFQPVPMVREATLADIEAVAALHGRCSVETLYSRYQTPLRLPMTTRLARRLVAPDAGVALVVQTGLAIVGHGVLEQHGDDWTFQLIVEDAWHSRGIGTRLVREAAERARRLGLRQLTFVSAGANDSMLRAVGAAGLVARVERHGELVHVTVPLGPSGWTATA